MRNKQTGFILLLFLLIFSACSTSLNLVKNNQTDYRIVIPENTTEIEQKAADELQYFLYEMSGVKIPLVADTENPVQKEICLGNTNRLQHPPVPLDSLKTDGFSIFTRNKKLFIVGGSEKGTLYGVYGFLEDQLGFRQYTSTVRHLPERKSISIPEKLEDTQVPVFNFREVLYTDTYEPSFHNWHKLDAHGGEKGEWGFWCHSFQTLVPPEKYGETNPEYYALVNGRRQPASQLCLTNEEVFEIVVENLQKAMEEKPEAQYWSVSQNDNQNYCRCEKCAAIDKEEGTPMGTMLRFVNRVAERFPDKVISTLAYQYTRSLPKFTRPFENVNIMLCSIECPRDLPIDEDPSSTSFCKDVEDWSSVTSNIILWDYVIQFKNLVSPFPNLHVLKPNIAFLAENDVNAMFQQGNREVGGEFAELRAYMIAKLLWNPDQDDEAIMEDFLNGFYNEAGPFLKKYIEIQEKALLESGMKLNIFGNPISAKETYLSASLMEQYNQLFDNAEKAVANQPEVLERVKIARLPLLYAELEIARSEGTSERGIYKKENGRIVVRESIPEKLDAFVTLANKQGVTRVKEWSTTPGEYADSYRRLLNRDIGSNLALNKPVRFIIEPGQRYADGAEKVLTNGAFGSYDFAINWLGCEGKHMEFVLDLQAETIVKVISLDFLQAHNDWIFLPESVEYYGSADGKRFFLIEKVNNSVEDNRAILVESFESRLQQPQKLQFIKVKVQSPLECPSWHPGAGNPAWIFSDEIIVQ